MRKNYKVDYSNIRGFNYQPSYCSTGLENWLYFNPNTIELELRRGKNYFPVMNTIRYWLSWDAFIRDKKTFRNNFERLLSIADKLDISVMPCLFNRWHSKTVDYGGVYLSNLIDYLSLEPLKKDFFMEYLTQIVGEHKEDKRIIAWDLCNEPFFYEYDYKNPDKIMSKFERVEYEWLKRLYYTCKDLGCIAPIGIGIHSQHGKEGLLRVEPISDILFVHPYYLISEEFRCYDFIELLDEYAKIKNKTKKPMVANECCWGSLNDEKRVEFIRVTLTELKKRDIGWVVYGLNHSIAADLHRSEFGPVGPAENLAFIEADGSLRKGHEIFNEF